MWFVIISFIVFVDGLEWFSDHQLNGFLITRAMGCIFGELMKHRPLMPGQSDLEQLELIFKLLGTPTAKIAPVREWKLFDQMNVPVYKYVSERIFVVVAIFASVHKLGDIQFCRFTF